MMDWSQHFAARTAHMQASEIRELLKLLAQPDIISFAGGIPDPNLFPVAEIETACKKILGAPDLAAAALQYSVSEGYLPLRQWIANYMGTQGVPCSPDNIMITNGSQQGLDFLAKLFVMPGETVLTDSPTYLGALQAFSAYEPKYDVLPQAGSGRTMESYRNEAGQAPKFAYVMPEFQNPTGNTLSRAEREAVLDSADQLDMPVVEDNAYNVLRYDGETLPPLLALSIKRKGDIDQSRVIYCGTFSKSIVPALRIGWIVAARPVIEKLVLIKQASDLHVATFNQMIMFEVASRILDKHTAGIREVYKSRRDAMLKALDRFMPEGVTWTKPEGGMFVWVTVPEGLNAADLLAKAIKVSRVAFVPGSAFFPGRTGLNTFRLSFSLNPPEKVEEGIRRLGDLLKAEMAAMRQAA